MMIRLSVMKPGVECHEMSCKPVAQFLPRHFCQHKVRGKGGVYVFQAWLDTIGIRLIDQLGIINIDHRAELAVLVNHRGNF